MSTEFTLFALIKKRERVTPEDTQNIIKNMSKKEKPVELSDEEVKDRNNRVKRTEKIIKRAFERYKTAIIFLRPAFPGMPFGMRIVCEDDAEEIDSRTRKDDDKKVSKLKREQKKNEKGKPKRSKRNNK